VVGNIIPIYKNKGDSNDPKNFRPITLVSCLGKLFTAILRERLSKYSDDFFVMDLLLLKIMFDLISLYIFCITFNIFPFILLINNLYHNPSRQILSKAFSKSINAQYIFSFSFLKVQRMNTM
jgi:hypothetical protein